MKRQLGMFALCASLATASLAHEGHDHGDADKAPPIVGNQPQRLADGTVFIPKSAQRGMGVLTLKASSETVARSLELPGRVIMDPHLGGRVQAMQPGRVVKRGVLIKPDRVRRDEFVTLVFEAPGITLSMRGKALEAGAAGDLVNVLNVQSKRNVQGHVSGPARVTVSSSTAAVSPQSTVAAYGANPRSE